MIVKFTKPISEEKFCSLVSWLFETYGGPPKRWRLENLTAIWFENYEDGVYCKLVWSHL
jgi:hypothetical protein